MTLLLQLPASTPQMEITEALAGAIAEASKLPAEDQNFLAFRNTTEAKHVRLKKYFDF